MERLRVLASQAIWGPVPYGWPFHGDAASRDRIGKKDVAAFFRQVFTASNVTVVIASDLSAPEVQTLCGEFLAVIPPGPRLVPALPVLPVVPEYQPVVSALQNEGTLAAVAMPLPAFTIRNFACTEILETALGKGVDSSLWALRSESGMAYNFGTEAILLAGGGVLTVYAQSVGTPQEKLADRLNSIVDSVWKEGLSPGMLASSVCTARLNVLNRLESKDYRTAQLALLQDLGLGYPMAEELPQLIGTVTREEMNRFIKTVLAPACRSRILIGPVPSSKK